MTMTVVLLGGVLLSWGIMMIVMWPIWAGRADDELDRYFRAQQAHVRQHECATRSQAIIKIPPLLLEPAHLDTVPSLITAHDRAETTRIGWARPNG